MAAPAGLGACPRLPRPFCPPADLARRLPDASPRSTGTSESPAISRRELRARSSLSRTQDSEEKVSVFRVRRARERSSEIDFLFLIRRSKAPGSCGRLPPARLGLALTELTLPLASKFVVLTKLTRLSAPVCAGRAAGAPPLAVTAGEAPGLAFPVLFSCRHWPCDGNVKSPVSRGTPCAPAPVPGRPRGPGPLGPRPRSRSLQPHGSGRPDLGESGFPPKHVPLVGAPAGALGGG